MFACIFISAALLAPPVQITGMGEMSVDNLSGFLLEQNPQADSAEVRMLACLYIQEGAHENINADIAFSQMCLETGFLSFQGLVRPWMNNFCGLGAIGAAEPGLSFPDMRTGVRAHVQHLKAYGSTEPLNMECVDPRFGFVNPRGRAPDIYALAGTWATDPLYGEKLYSILERLYQSALYRE